MADSGIKRCKKLVFRQHSSFGERIEEGRFTGIRIANYSYDRDGLCSTLSAVYFALFAYPFNLLT